MFAAFLAPPGEHGVGYARVTERQPRGQVEHHLVPSRAVTKNGDALSARPGQLVAAQRPLSLTLGQLRLDRGLPDPALTDDCPGVAAGPAAGDRQVLGEWCASCGELSPHHLDRPGEPLLARLGASAD